MESRDMPNEQELTELERLRARVAQLEQAEKERKAHVARAFDIVQHLKVISDVNLAHLSLEEMLGELMHRLQQVMEVDFIAILLPTLDGKELMVRAALGFEVEGTQELQFPVGSGALGSIAANREPLLVDDLQKTALDIPLLKKMGVRALLGVPLLVEGQVMGVALVGTQRPRSFTQNEIRLLQLASDRIGLAVDRARLHGAEQQARAEVIMAQQRLAFLADASNILSRSLDYQATLNTIVHLAVPRLSDWCALDLLGEDGKIERLAVAHLEREKESKVFELAQQQPFRSDSANEIAEVLRTRQSLAVRDTAKTKPVYQRTSGLQKLLEELGLKSYMVVPLEVRGKILGTFTFVAGASGRTYDKNDLALAEELGRRAAQAIDNANLYRTAQEETHRKEESLALLDTLLAAAPVGMAFLDTNLRYVRINDSLAEVNGIPAEQHLGRTIEELLPDLAPGLAPLFRQIMESGKPVIGLEVSGQTPKTPGDIRYWLSNYYPVRASSGEVLGIGLVVTEITERKRTEAALLAERERLSVTLRSIGDGVITTDISGKVVLINEVAEHLTAWSQSEAIGQPLARVFRLRDRKNRRLPQNPVEEVLKTGETAELVSEVALVARDNSEHPISSNAAPIRDNEGKLVGAVLVFRDITEELKIAEERLRSSKLESASILAGGIAHDFNNILTVVLGNLSLARLEVEDNMELYSFITTAEKAAARARDLTQQLLTFAKGGESVKTTALLPDIIKESAQFGLSGSNVRGEFSMPSSLWPVKADKGQLGQVIQNLVINAVQAMPGGGNLEVWAENVHLTENSGLPLEPGPYVCISIRDHGTGIRPENLGRIFDPYFTTKKTGTGLGLATTYSIVKNHGGYITVDSRLGVGTTFHVYLPASNKAVASNSTVETAPLKGQGRVLVMDDDDTVRRMLGLVLKKLGYEVKTVKHGDEVLRVYREAMAEGRPVDIVIMDLTIRGGMGGKETIQKLQELDPHVKAIVSSGYSEDPVMARYRDFGFKGAVSKPYRVEDLGRVLHEVMANSPHPAKYLDSKADGGEATSP